MAVYKRHLPQDSPPISFVFHDGVRSEVRLGTQHSQLIVVAKVAIIIANNQGTKEQLTFETAVPVLN